MCSLTDVLNDDDDDDGLLQLGKLGSQRQGICCHLLLSTHSFIRAGLRNKTFFSTLVLLRLLRLRFKILKRSNKIPKKLLLMRMLVLVHPFSVI
jgi:hypothetical protein